MLTNILKRILTDRKSNGWLFAELFLVFVILWFVVDFLFGTLYTSREPKGYDTHNVYHVSIGANPMLEKESRGNDTWTEAYRHVFRAIGEYPGVESACYYAGTIPYERGSIFQGYTVDSVHTYLATIRMVSREFFDVFRVELNEADLSNWDIAGYPRPAVLSKDLADSLFNMRPSLGDDFADYYAPHLTYKVGGITPRTKKTEYDKYEPFIYVPTEDWMMKSLSPFVAIRVRPEAEKGFATRFTEDMRDRLSIGPFYFSQIRSYDEAKDAHDTSMNNYIRSSVAVVLFFVFNVFLSIMGTFWFRTRKRAPEIGLRIALGASKARVSTELIVESVCILMLSAIPAIIVCFNIWRLDLTVNILMDPTASRLLTGLLITLALMLLMVMGGIWYPARMAKAVQPAEALRDE